MPPLLIFIPAALIGGAFFIDKTGEAIDDTANGIVKIALVAGGLYFIAKKTKVI